MKQHRVQQVMRDYQVEVLHADVIASLRERRLALRMSQDALAAAAGVKQEQISYFEQGRRDPSLLTTLRLAHALGLRVLLRPVEDMPGGARGGGAKRRG